MKKYFFITGLPRSRTAWISALFNTHEDVICLHEPINQFGSWETIKDYMDSLPYKHVGVSDSTIAIHSYFFKENFSNCPVIFVKRDENEVINSLKSFLFISKEDSEKIIAPLLDCIPFLLQTCYKTAVVEYDLLNNNKVIKAIWDYCIPEIKFDKNKCEQFQRLLINQHKVKILSEMEIENQSILNDN